ncbi:carboxylesterase family protein [Rhizobium laguerreae]|uniref:carboxylesterase family protein n=1 Tax=Rhizobium laguerreae TaxID=1076926 RepID=UPI001FE65659|nr:carboxylesterase family protein [Rhizobium laguerreae]
MTASIVGAPALAEEFVASQSKTVVETKKGSLVGALDDGIYSYLGVPYAHADRFMPAEEVAPWQGIRPAVTYGENCFIPRMKEVAGDELFNPHRYLPMSEACQFLNIWTPAIKEGKKRPVMVWIHGGGFTNGSGIELTSYDGHNLSKEGDVVVVTLNHRLNVLGFLDLSAYGEKYKRSGNASATDLVAALQWVQDNAEAFGGDPGNVTIFGQSGGGYKVRALMGTPSAKGLFQKAIVQSGSRTDSVVDQASSRKVAELTLANLGLKAEEIDKVADVIITISLPQPTKPSRKQPPKASRTPATRPFRIALALSRTVSQAWVNFARNGKPSAEGLPDWPAYTTDNPATMVLDKESRVAVDLDRKLLQTAGAL